MTSSSSISTLEIRQWETSRFYLRVEWTSAFKGFYSKLSLDEKWASCNADYENWTPVTTSVEQRNTCWNTILHIACITDVCFYCVFQASGGKREEDVERERNARRRTCLELLACFALAFARLQNCRLQDAALKTATSLALNLPWRRFCPCKANHLNVDY